MPGFNARCFQRSSSSVSYPSSSCDAQNVKKKGEKQVVGADGQTVVSSALQQEHTRECTETSGPQSVGI